ncbi:MAG TPA: sugar transferase, partial [Bryobacteraceae bacterium]|nr:sugar transferase [Bryobacteraceae bacterium]
YRILEVDPAVYLLYDGGMGRILLTLVTILLGMHLHDLYSVIQVKSRLLLLQQVCQVMGLAFLSQALFGYLSAELILPRWVMVLGCGLSLLAIMSWRLFYGAFVIRALGEQKLLLLGRNDLALQIAQHLTEKPEFGMRVVGYLDNAADGEAPPGGPMRLGGVAELREVASATKPDCIVVGLRERRGNVPLSELLDLRFSGVKIEEAATTFENLLKRVSLHDLRPAQLIYSGELGPRPSRVALQLVYSTLIALAGLILCAPLMLLAALAVKLTSPGPVLYRQIRVGWQGRLFTVLKFRSMHENAEAATGAVWASKEDPRVTRVGRWLRLLRLDELPQFINVLRGEMSLVGPRPERPEFVDMLAEKIPYYRQRHFVRPGITGWAQLNHKYGDSLEDAARKLEYDLYYIKHMSPALDAFIIFHTVKTVILSRGAQ